MRYPLDGNPRITSTHGSSAPGSRFGKHLGIDRAVGVGTPVYAPGDGVVTSVSTGASGGKQIEIRIGAHDWRFLHLSEQLVRVGQTVTEGQLIAKSGNTGQVRPAPTPSNPHAGAHLHYDARKAGTPWDLSFSNYVDPDVLIRNSQNSHPYASWVGRKVRLSAAVSSWRVYKVGSVPPRKEVARLNPKKFGGLIYTVEATDKAPNSVIITTQDFGRVSLPIDKDASLVQ